MANRSSFENLFRSPWELLVAAIGVGFGTVCLVDHEIVALSQQMSVAAAIPFFALACIRAKQGLKVLLFRRRLLQLKSFSMSTNEVPISLKHQYVGHGFQWLPIHRQRLHLLSLVENQGYIQKNVIYRYVQAKAKEAPKGICAQLTSVPLLPFKPMPDIGGKPWLHGVGSDEERPIFVNQSNRAGHKVTFGTTGVGKTRVLSIEANQDIRNGEALLIIDPKGDLEICQDLFCAAEAAGRLGDLSMVHLGFPDLSAKYNPLASFSNVSEVATRITDAMSASGDGQAFKDFAWQYLNIVASCLHELGSPINYTTISFYVKRPEVLLITYVDKVFPKIEPGYLSKVQEIIDDYNSRTDQDGNSVQAIKRSVAIKMYLTNYIEAQASSGEMKHLMEGVIVPLFNAATLDKTYYDKITASVGPILDKINQTQARGIFSWKESFGLPEIRLEDIIKRKQIVYIGLDSLTNREMAEAVGQAIISDLVSLCGRLYNESSETKNVLNVYCDEFSNIVRESFANLLNKARGVGIRVSAYTQTINDLFAAMGGNHDKAKMLIGNFNTVTMLRVRNADTATTFIDCLEMIRARSSTPSTMSNDRADSNNGELFTTYNTDTISETKTSIIEVNDLYSLPKGQSFMMTNGGELYKLRFPLPKNTGNAPETFEAILSEVNLCFGS